MDDLDGVPSAEAAVDLGSTMWSFPEFIAAMGALNEKNVVDYFSHSPFFDRQSSNQVLKMQRMHTGEEQVPGQEEEDLKKFTGIEFAVVHARPPSLFIIHKRERFSPTEVSPVAAYFVVHNNIYQSHDLHALLSTRLTTSITSLESSFSLLRSTLAQVSPFHPRSESQFVLSAAKPPTLLPASATSEAPAGPPTVDSPAPGGQAGPSTPSASQSQSAPSSTKRPSTQAATQPDPSSSSNPSLALLFALRTTLTSLPSLVSSSSTAPPPPPPPASGPSSSLARPDGSTTWSYPTGGRPSPFAGGAGTTPSGHTPMSVAASKRGTPAGGAGMVPTPPPSSKNVRNSPAELGGGGQGQGPAKKKKKKTGGGGAGGAGQSTAATPVAATAAGGSSQAGTPGGGGGGGS